MNYSRLAAIFQRCTFLLHLKKIFVIRKSSFPNSIGKIEIFSKRLYDMNNVDIPALSHYVPAIEGPEDKLTEKYLTTIFNLKGK